MWTITEAVAYSMFVTGSLLFLFTMKFRIAYGRFCSSGVFDIGPKLSAKLCWFIHELPFLLIPALCLLRHSGLFPAFRTAPTVNRLLLLLYVIFYFYRDIIYVYRMRTGARNSLFVLILGITIGVWNGSLQGYSLILDPVAADYEINWFSYSSVRLGICIYLLGFILNVNSDSILRNLRTPGDTKYYIPKGGLYSFVSCPNYLGEILVWFGWALCCQNLAATVWCLFTIQNLVPRALHCHDWYRKKFEDYPRNITALVPYLL